MAPVIRVSEELYGKLEKLAVGFDTPANVIERLLEGHSAAPSKLNISEEKQPETKPKRKRQLRAITPEMARKACVLGEKVFNGHITRDEARRDLESMGMSSGSAQIYLYDYCAMREGKIYKRGMKPQDLRIFLSYIEDRFGDGALAMALEAVGQNIKYENAEGYPSANRDAVFDEFKNRVRL